MNLIKGISPICCLRSITINACLYRAVKGDRSVALTQSAEFPPKHVTMSWRRPVISGGSLEQEASAGSKRIPCHYFIVHNMTYK